ncbi:hypothetical protein [Sphingobacterium endophyticum]|uniref:hypothetical protein n=1 Tax=Sphingobacterium endophyticum TaxID=2546448 RepID=UPI0012E148B6|nr:hypothetical protein [Sphingobacterium endophyticum]
MKKILNIVSILTLAVGIISCSKSDEEVRTPLENTELVGKWAKVESIRNTDSIIVDGPHLDTVKVLEITAENTLKVSRGLFCSLTTDKGKNQDGSYEYYSVNNKDNAGTSNRIKLDKCGKGMPVSVQGDVLILGYGNQTGANEEYRRVKPATTPEEPEVPEVPEEPIDPGTGE